jgi:hypothetical protein
VQDQINESMGIPHRVESLFDLLTWYSDFFIETFSFLNRIESVVTDASDSAMVGTEATLAVYAKVGVLMGLCDMHKFTSIADQCRRIHLTLETKHMSVTPSEMKRLLNDLRQRCDDEFKNRVFLSLEINEGRTYNDPCEHWEAVHGRFYKVKFNIEESLKCFALTRYAASVFHVLLVVEYGVIQLADFVGIKAGHPGWGYVKPLQDAIKEAWPKRPAHIQANSRLLEAVVPLLYQVKESWRHKISHVDSLLVWEDTDFSPQVADEIIKASRGFMRKLASDLPRSKP